MDACKAMWHNYNIVYYSVMSIFQANLIIVVRKSWINQWYMIMQSNLQKQLVQLKSPSKMGVANKTLFAEYS